MAKAKRSTSHKRKPGRLRMTTPKDLPRWGATKKTGKAYAATRELKNRLFKLENDYHLVVQALQHANAAFARLDARFVGLDNRVTGLESRVAR